MSAPPNNAAHVNKKYPAALQVVWYIARHVRRTYIRTAIATLLAAVLAGACGFLAMTRQTYIDIFDGLEVVGTLNSFSSEMIGDAEQSALTRDLYYSGGYYVIAGGIFTQLPYYLAVTNDIDQYIRSKSADDYSVTYLDGYAPDMFKLADSDNQSVVTGSVLAEFFDVGLGENIDLLSYQFANEILVTEVNAPNLLEQIAAYDVRFTIAGIVESDDIDIALGIFAPISHEVERMAPLPELPFTIEYCRFIVADNEMPQELLGYVDELSKYRTYYIDRPEYHIDFTELENTRRVRDQLNAFFPVALTAAVILGLAAPALIIFSSAKEAACLRILGTTKRRVYCIFAAEQIMLCIFGISLASLSLMIYNYGAFARSSDTLFLCGALILGGNALAATLSGVILTRKDIFRLLQARE